MKDIYSSQKPVIIEWIGIIKTLIGASMRRKDREVSTFEDIIQIIEKCGVCRLGLSVENHPYVVPLNFGYEVVGGKLVLYFHGANAGKKLEMIDQNPLVCFEVDCDHQLYENEKAHEYSFEYSSVIGYGEIQRVKEPAECNHALQKIMQHYTGQVGYELEESTVSRLAILKLEVSQMSGKSNKR